MLSQKDERHMLSEKCEELLRAYYSLDMAKEEDRKKLRDTFKEFYEYANEAKAMHNIEDLIDGLADNRANVALTWEKKENYEISGSAEQAAEENKKILRLFDSMIDQVREIKGRVETTVEGEKVSAVHQKVLVAGSRRIQSNYNEISKLAKTIGAKIMRVDNWILLNGGASEGSSETNRSIDYLVCIGAQEELKDARNLKLEKEKILTLLPDDTDRSLFHEIGKIETVKGADLSSRRNELVEQADAIITIEGVKGTNDIIKDATDSRKPVLPIACTGGKSKKAWDDNEKDILQTFGIKKPSKEYEMLTTNKGLARPADLSELVIKIIKEKLKPVDEKQKQVGFVGENGFQLDLNIMEPLKRYVLFYEQVMYEAMKNFKGDLELTELLISSNSLVSPSTTTSKVVEEEFLSDKELQGLNNSVRPDKRMRVAFG